MVPFVRRSGGVRIESAWARASTTGRSNLLPAVEEPQHPAKKKKRPRRECSAKSQPWWIRFSCSFGSLLQIERYTTRHISNREFSVRKCRWVSRKVMQIRWRTAYYCRRLLLMGAECKTSGVHGFADLQAFARQKSIEKWKSYI